MEIDLNCDLGEGCAHDAELLPLVTSASIACGFHAGDPATARVALERAIRLGVQTGAHPSFPDRENFGREEMERAAQDIFDDCIFQVGALAALARAAGGRLSHLKPHGALYNMACRSDAYARPIIDAARFFDLPVMALPGSRLQALAAGRCPFIAEGFADRRYQPDGSLVPRNQSGAMIEDAAEAVEQVRWLLHERGVQTICVHGDNPRALNFVQTLRDSLGGAGISIQPFRVA